ncbi:MAG: efflux RND transporter periplasmic adaptor subunit [Gammaproteobacteria bacterium]|nr:efflux RND transporter periplasmic adaptor subunit [Gammaproteobacteria bacterium]MBU1414391.1 efflux RND transporter periplasmic adaptor subunit [Gammaproteobacteria bacterium]
MSKTTLITLGVAAVAVALGVGYWAGAKVSRGDTPPGTEAAVADAGGKKLLYYRNPMGLPDTSPVPKKDSMGMDYIPVYEGDEPDDSGAVKVSPVRVQTLGVKTALAEEKVLDAAVRTVGRIEVDERAIAEVAPKFDGWIEKLFVSAVGDPVRRGQPLFSVYSPELVSAQQELAIAESLKLDAPGADPAARENAQRLAAATRERLKNWDMNAAGGVPRRLTFSSPANGVVLEKKAVEGMRFAAGTTIYRIADLSTVWVIADAYEQDLAKLRVGQPATVTVDALPERRFAAKVSYLYPTLNARTRTTQLRLELRNADGLLRPGMFAHVDVAIDAGQARLTVPGSAVIDTGARQVVLLELGEGRYKPQPVKIGVRGSDAVEILDGLKAGDRVVVAANFLIDAESNLKAALANFSEPDAAAAKSYSATGTLDAVDAATHSVTVTHQPIAALKWPAMTMDFNLASPEVVAGVAPGTPMDFEFEERGPGEFAITRITPKGR